MSEPKNTPLPWRAKEHSVFDVNGEWTAAAYSAETAAHIVACVNAMPAMVEALKSIRAYCQAMGPSQDRAHFMELTGAALKAYEES